MPDQLDSDATTEPDVDKELHWLMENEPIDEPSDYITYHATVYDMRVEDAEGLITWLYSLCEGQDKAPFNSEKLIDIESVQCKIEEITAALLKVKSFESFYDKDWLKQVIRKLSGLLVFFYKDASFKNWGEFLKQAQKAEKQYQRLLVEAQFGGLVTKRRYQVPSEKPEGVWEDLE